MTQGAQTCRHCGAALNPDETRGLCPACLLQTTLAADDEAPHVNGPVDAAWLERNQLVESAEPAATPQRLGDYELLEEIGRGGMGVIYRARQVSLDRLVAVKTILTGPLASPDFAQRFHTEAHAAAVLDHPHIVPIYEVGTHHGQPFYSMRLIPGRNLAQELKATGAMAPRRAAALVATVAHAVHYAHQRGILHRDLKPANILLDAEGQPHVTDFGLAKLLEQDDGLTLTQAALGTPNYMAPEQAAGKVKHLTVAADTYSLGAILWESLTGRRLFEGLTPVATITQVLEKDPLPPSSLNRAIPRDLDTICLKCLQKEPDRRYESALKLAVDLDHWLAGEPIEALPVGPVGRTWRWCRRKPALAGALGAATVLLLLGIAGIAWQWRRAVASERHARLSLYAADMNLAQQAVLESNYGEAKKLLNRHRPERGNLDLRGWEWRYLWSECQGDERFTLGHHTNQITSIDFSRNGLWVASASHDSAVKIWDFRSQCEIASLPQEDRGYGVAFSPDNLWVATASGSNVRLYETSTWHLRQTITNGFMTFSVIFSPDSRRLAAEGLAGVKVWQVQNQELLLEQRVTDGWIMPKGVVFSPDNRWLAYYERYADGAIALWDLDTQQRVATLAGERESIFSLDFSPDGRWLASATWWVVRIWDLGSMRQFTILTNLGSAVHGLKFSPDGKILATGGADQLIRLWNTETWQQQAALKGHMNEVWSVAFSPDGKYLVSGSKDETVKVWNVTPRVRPKNRVIWGRDPPAASQLSPDGTACLTIFDNTSWRLWNIPDLAESGPWPLPVARGCARFGSVGPGALSPGGSSVATCDLDGTLKVWSTGSRQVVADFTDPSNRVWGSAFSADGRWIAIGRSNQTIEVCSLDARHRRMVLPKRPTRLHSLALSGDGRVLAAGYADFSAEVWNVPERRRVMPVFGHKSRVVAIAVSLDGRFVGTASEDATVKLCDVDRAEVVATSGAQLLAWYSVAFSPDNRRLVAGGADGMIKIWDVPSMREVGKLNEPEPRWAVRFSSDGNSLVTTGWDSVRVWRAPSLAEIEAVEKNQKPANPLHR